jgi:hypothetical protein
MAEIDTIFVEAKVFPNLLALPKSVKIGDIEAQTALEEIHHDSLQITQHPVESGASITDHSFARQAELMLTVGWSNSNLKAILGAIESAFTGGTMSKADYVTGVYSQLLALQKSRVPATITTGLRIYDNMLISGLTVKRDQRTSQILLVEASFLEVIIVSTRSTTLPAKESQADPASTAEVQNSGTKQIVSRTPSPGSALPFPTDQVAP